MLRMSFVEEKFKNRQGYVYHTSDVKLKLHFLLYEVQKFN